MSEDKIKVDYDSKEVTVDIEEADMKALAMALKDSGFSMAGM
ncbi:MAG: hypothetical protein ACI8QC_002169 [Planctomycetota bacterium]